MAQPPSSNGGSWAALIQAHLANLTTHKELLESLAQDMSTQQTLDEALVVNMEAMYSRTVEIMQQAHSVKTFFEGLGDSRSATNLSTGPSAKRGPLSKPKASSNAVPGSALHTHFAGRRRQRIESNNQADHYENESKRRRLGNVPSTTGQSSEPPSAQESGVEYVDVSKEVLRRLAAARQRRMAKKANEPRESEETTRKRTRQSSGSGRSLSQARHAEPLLPANKRPRKEQVAKEEAEHSAKQVEDGFASAEEDGKTFMPGAFESGSDTLGRKQKFIRTKSIV